MNAIEEIKKMFEDSEFLFIEINGKKCTITDITDQYTINFELSNRSQASMLSVKLPEDSD